MTGIIGMIFAFAMIIAAFVLEGGHLSGLWEYTALMIVLGGTVGAVTISFPMDEIKKVPSMLKVAFSNKKANLPELISYFKNVSSKTRKNGLLSLESEISEDAGIDPFIKKGLQMAVDGLEPQSVRSTLELEAEMTEERHKRGYAIFESAGGYSPTMGIIGTVTGLVHVLSNMEDPTSLAASIAVAFIATLYGIGFANLIWLPIATRLKAIDTKESDEKQLIIEAVLLIQEGANPNFIGEKLKSYLNKDELAQYEQLDKVAEV